MRKAYKVWCEWDVGQENLVFMSKDSAMIWLKQNEILNDVIHDNDGSLEEVFDRGLVSLEEIDLM